MVRTWFDVLFGASPKRFGGIRECLVRALDDVVNLVPFARIEMSADLGVDVWICRPIPWIFANTKSRTNDAPHAVRIQAGFVGNVYDHTAQVIGRLVPYGDLGFWALKTVSLRKPVHRVSQHERLHSTRTAYHAARQRGANIRAGATLGAGNAPGRVPL